MQRDVKGGPAGRPPTQPRQAARGDGRSTRWSEHRESRRAQLVLAAVAAIDEHGPDVGIGDIAAAAGVSKPVLYRYFSDKDDIHAAVGQWGAALVLERLSPALLDTGSIRSRVEHGVDAYLAVLEEHPHVFALLLRHRATSAVGSPDDGRTDPLADGKAAIASAIARVMGDAMRDLGLDAGGAEPWAHGLVGLGLSTGEWWLDRQTMSRKHVGAYLSDFVWHALGGVMRSRGVEVDGGEGDDGAAGPHLVAVPQDRGASTTSTAAGDDALDREA